MWYTKNLPVLIFLNLHINSMNEELFYKPDFTGKKTEI